MGLPYPSPTLPLGLLLAAVVKCICASAWAQAAAPTPSSAPTSHHLSLRFPPVPAEDRAQGRNDNAYNPARNATPEEQEQFVARYQSTALNLARQTGVPASVLLAMACVESGYGLTRTGALANNYFGIKQQSGELDEVYQLIGQPNEDGDTRNFALEVIANDENRIIFDEPRRRTNRYRRFATPADGFAYLATTLLQNDRYRGATAAYTANRRRGMPRPDAAAEFARDIGARGYHHLGGNYYRDRVIVPMLQKHHLTDIDP